MSSTAEVKHTGLTARRVLVVIVNYRSAALTLNAVRSLQPERDKAGLELKVVVVENQSGDEAALREGLADFADVTLIVAERNGGFAYGNNLGFKFAYESGWLPDYFHLLNPDTVAYPGAVSELVAFLDAHPKVGIAGSRFENADGSEWPMAFRFPTLISEFEDGLSLGVVSNLLRPWVVTHQVPNEPSRVDWLPGASMMLRREMVEQLGGMDESYFLYFEETDFCLKAIRAGWETWHVPRSRVMHIAGQSTGVTSADAGTRPLPAYWYESRSRYFRKNHGLAYAALTDALAIGASVLGDAKEQALLRGSRKPRFVRDLTRHALRLLKNEELAPEQAFPPPKR